MEPSQEMSVTVEATKSMSAVEFDADTDCFQATYDGTHDSTSLAVVGVVATALGRDPLELTPLQSIIETDALEQFAVESSNGLGNGDKISFCYEEFHVTVYGEGVIEASPTENT